MIPADNETEALDLARKLLLLRIKEEHAAAQRVTAESRAAKLEAKGWEAWWRAIFGDKLVDVLESHHRDAIAWHWEARQALNRGEVPPSDHYAYFAPWSRGHMKSTIARRIAICDAAISKADASGNRGYCLYIGGTKEKIEGHAKSIDTLLSKPELLAYYPKLNVSRKTTQGHSKGWKAQFFYTDHGYIFHFVSLEEGLAGANVDDIRPSLMVPDDIDGRKDSAAVAEKRFDVFTTEILPAKQEKTIFFYAQNLINRNAIAYKIYKQKVRVLTNRKPIKPVPAVRGLQTELRTVNGIVKDVVVAGESTWRGWDMTRVQNEIDTYGLSAFLRECQHEVEQAREGLVLPEWDESVHVISWSQFERVFGQRSIPRHWAKHAGMDYGQIHPAPFIGRAVAASNSRMPGCHFWFKLVTHPQSTAPDEMALRLIEALFPWDEAKQAGVNTKPIRTFDPDLTAKYYTGNPASTLDAPRNLAQKLIKDQVRALFTAQGWRSFAFSHEQKRVRELFMSAYGLPVTGVNPGAEGGLEEMRRLLKVDYNTPHPFKEDVKGYSGVYVIVADDEYDTAVTDAGFKLLRDQFPDWVRREEKLTEQGLQDDRPMKVHDDAGNALMMSYHLKLGITPLTTDEQIERQVHPRFQVTEENESKIDDPAWLMSRLVHRDKVTRKVEAVDKELAAPGWSAWAGTL